jgi:predicted permease
MLTMPLLYTAILGFVFNYFNLFKDLLNNKSYIDFMANFRGGYSLLGVMLIGFGVSKIKKFEIDWKFLSFGFIAKFVVWPLLLLILIFLDKNYFNIMDGYLINGVSRPDIVYQTFLILSLVPMGANIVAMSLEFNISPEKTAVTIFLSYVFAIFYIPLILSFLMGLV